MLKIHQFCFYVQIFVAWTVLKIHQFCFFLQKAEIQIFPAKSILTVQQVSEKNVRKPTHRSERVQWVHSPWLADCWGQGVWPPAGAGARPIADAAAGRPQPAACCSGT